MRIYNYKLSPWNYIWRSEASNRHPENINFEFEGLKSYSESSLHRLLVKHLFNNTQKKIPLFYSNRHK